METHEDPAHEATHTLDPPGTIAIVGAGPLGIEAALYGRYLGYDVTLFEQAVVGASLIDQLESPLPMGADRCLSPLALAALNAQYPEQAPRKFPETIGEWLTAVLTPLMETDLLVGRIQQPASVTKIESVTATDLNIAPEQSADHDDESADQDELSPDFRITIDGDDFACPIFEAVILAIGADPAPALVIAQPHPFFARIGAAVGGQAEQDFQAGLRDIVACFARFTDRQGLDLYRPRRL